MEKDQMVRELLQSLINKKVREKLGSIGADFSHFEKDAGADKNDLKQAKAIVLEMIRDACQGFYTDASIHIGSEIKEKF